MILRIEEKLFIMLYPSRSHNFVENMLNLTVNLTELVFGMAEITELMERVSNGWKAF